MGDDDGERRCGKAGEATDDVKSQVSWRCPRDWPLRQPNEERCGLKTSYQVVRIRFVGQS